MSKLYERVGRRFVPVHEWRHYEVYQDGAWLTIVDPERHTTTVRPVDPAFVDVEAALYEVEDAMVTAMMESAKLKPRTRDATAKEKKAYAAYCKIMGPEVALQLEGKSFWDIAQAGLERIREIIKLNRNLGNRP